MNINITGRKTIVKDSFRESAEKRLQKFDRFFDDDAAANITVTNEGGRETVEITIKTRTMTYRAEKTTDDRMISLDQAVDLLFKQIVKNKGKLEKRIKQAVPEFADYPQVEPETDFRLVRTKHFRVKPMAVDEAILEMEMLGHSFYMFMNGETGTISVVYRRNDGDYALIEPEL